MSMCSKTRWISGFVGFVVALSGVYHVKAQYAGPAVTSQPAISNSPATGTATEFADIKIAPGDIISISTYGAPELTTSNTASASNITGNASPAVTGLKVGARGEVVLPYIGMVMIAGRTAFEASQLLAEKLKQGGFLVDPQVSVQIVDSPSRIISVIGEVQKPAAFPSFGHLKLLDAIAVCGGLTQLASHSITIRRAGIAQPITVELGVNPDSAEASDIPLEPGDTVIVPKVGNVFIVGEVKTPAAIPLGGNTPMTVVRAISMAGGLNFSAALSQARIIRTNPDHQKVEIMLDLKKILYGKQQDVALLSDDVLYVPMNGFKAALSSGGASVLSNALYGAAATVTVLK